MSILSCFNVLSSPVPPEVELQDVLVMIISFESGVANDSHLLEGVTMGGILPSCRRAN